MNNLYIFDKYKYLKYIDIIKIDIIMLTKYYFMYLFQQIFIKIFQSINYS